MLKLLSKEQFRLTVLCFNYITATLLESLKIVRSFEVESLEEVDTPVEVINLFPLKTISKFNELNETLENDDNLYKTVVRRNLSFSFL